jgi:hypothetical protein
LLTRNKKRILENSCKKYLNAFVGKLGKLEVVGSFFVFKISLKSLLLPTLVFIKSSKKNEKYIIILKKFYILDHTLVSGETKNQRKISCY